MIQEHVSIDTETRVQEAQNFLERHAHFDSVTINSEQIFNDQGDSDCQDKDITDLLLPGHKDIMPSLIEFTPFGWYFLHYKGERISKRLSYELLKPVVPEVVSEEMVFSRSGEILLVENFWDCECEKDFIHRKSTTPTCSICGTSHEDQPDSRANEVLELIGRQLTTSELESITKELGLPEKPNNDHAYVLIDLKNDEDSVEVFSSPESVETAFRRTIINNWFDRFGTECPVNTPEQITDKMIDEYTSREESGESIKKTNWYKRAIC